jgi:hypothetical protein
MYVNAPTPVLETDDIGVMQKAIEQGSVCSGVYQCLSPMLQLTVEESRMAPDS